jgi:hypothetical protein
MNKGLVPGVGPDRRALGLSQIAQRKHQADANVKRKRATVAREIDRSQHDEHCSERQQAAHERVLGRYQPRGPQRGNAAPDTERAARGAVAGDRARERAEHRQGRDCQQHERVPSKGRAAYRRANRSCSRCSRRRRQ